MNIKLVQNGIFPITKDKDGNNINRTPDTGYNIPGTLQGEGKTVGMPSIFIRISGCNLRCCWEMPDGTISICDTPYSSHDADDSINELWEIEDVISVLKHNLGNIKHIVITGGEPTTQAVQVTELAKRIKEEFEDIHITMETNGTIFNEQLAKYIDLFSISPKLKDSVPYVNKLEKLGRTIKPHRADNQIKLRRNIEVLQKYIDLCRAHFSIHDFQLKFVVTREENEREIKLDFLTHLKKVYNTDIVIMPVGGTTDILIQSTHVAAQMAIKNGWRFTPRLQVDLYGNKSGV